MTTKIDGVTCSTVCFIEASEMPDYTLLRKIGAISLTDYDTLEIREDTIREAQENYDGDDLYQIFIENIGIDVLDILMSGKLDFLMVIK